MPFVILGDEAYPLKTYLMKPFARKNLSCAERVFNYRLSRARKCVDCAFGILTAKRRLLNKAIETKVNKAERIVRCGNKMPTICNKGFYFRSYCLLNMFRAPLCPSSGAQEYYIVVAACGISCFTSCKPHT